MALGFKIADGYVEVHADYDKSELRRAAQQAADDYGDRFGKDKAHTAAGKAAGKQYAASFAKELAAATRRSCTKDFHDALQKCFGMHKGVPVTLGRQTAKRFGDGLNDKKIIGNAASSFFRSFIETVSFGQADIGGARPNSAFARWASRAGIAIGVTLATALILKAAEMIVALSPLLLASLSAIPIIFLAKTDKQVKAALKAWKKDAADFMQFVSQPIKIPFLKSLQEIRDGFTRLRVPVRDFFAAVGAGLPALARGGMDFLLNFFKALKPVLPNITLGMKLWGVELGKLGKALGDAFKIFLKDPDLLRKSIQGFSSFLQSLIKVFANLVVGLAYVSAAIGNFIRLIQIGFANSILPQWLSGVTAKWGPLKDAIVRAWEAFKKFATAEGDAEIKSRFSTLVDRIKEIWGALKPFLAEVFKLAWGLVKQVWNTYVVPWFNAVVMPWLKQKGRELINAMMDELVNQARTRFSNFVSSIPGMLAGMVSAITTPFTNAKTAAVNKAKELVTQVTTWLKGLPGKARAALSNLWGSISGAFTTATTRAKTAATNLVNGVVNFLKTLPGKARSAVSNLWSSMASTFTSAVSRAKTAATNLVTGFINIVKTLPSKARSAVSGVKGAIVGAFSGAGSWLVSAGRSIINGLASGIRSAVSGAVAAAASAARAALNAAKAAIGVASPSKAFAEEVGVPAAQGIAVGLREQFPEEMKGLRKSLPQLRLPEAQMAGAMAGGAGGGGFNPTINLYMQPGFYSENAAAKRALTKDVFLALEAYRKDYER